MSTNQIINGLVPVYVESTFQQAKQPLYMDETNQLPGRYDNPDRWKPYERNKLESYGEINIRNSYVVKDGLRFKNKSVI